jgi:hypothetical protein
MSSHFCWIYNHHILASRRIVSLKVTRNKLKNDIFLCNNTWWYLAQKTYFTAKTNIKNWKCPQVRNTYCKKSLTSCGLYVVLYCFPIFKATYNFTFFSLSLCITKVKTAWNGTSVTTMAICFMNIFVLIYWPIIFFRLEDKHYPICCL